MSEEPLDHKHEWEFLQTLWESTANSTTGTYLSHVEYAYFTCHECKAVEKRVVKKPNHGNKEEG